MFYKEKVNHKKISANKIYNCLNNDKVHIRQNQLSMFNRKQIHINKHWHRKVKKLQIFYKNHKNNLQLLS